MKIVKMFLKLLSLLVFLSGCVLSPLEAERKELASQNTQTFDSSKVVVNTTYLDNVDQYVNEFALMALFSDVVYRNDFGKNRDKLGCGYLQSQKEDTFGMPKSALGTWKRLNTFVAPTATTSIQPCINEKGLYAETYIHTNKLNQYDNAVIAIRGTENGTSRDFVDNWVANFSAAFNHQPAEYILARERILPVIAGLKSLYPNIEIYVTGHSLGGGMAQEIAYTSSDVKAAYVFNTSPVTNWTQLELQDAALVKQPHPVVKRIYESHEILSYVRLITDGATGKHINRSDYQFTFQKGNVVTEHSMPILACNFAKRIQGGVAEFDYSAEAAQLIVKNPCICPDKETKE